MCGLNETSEFTNSFSIECKAVDNFTTNKTPSKLILSTTGTTTTLQEKIIIDNTGFLSISGNTKIDGDVKIQSILSVS